MRISLAIAFGPLVFSPITVPIATLARLKPDCNDRDIGGARPGFEIQPEIVLRECEAWTVVDKNSRNARAFGARYWREG